MQKIKKIVLFELKLAIIVYVLSFAYELTHMPLFKDFGADTLWQKIFSAAHCSFGDLNPFMLGYHIVAILKRSLFWIETPNRKTGSIILILIAVIYTTVAEIIYVDVKHLWVYTEYMPVIPWMF